jgi:hypothetical protein
MDSRGGSATWCVLDESAVRRWFRPVVPEWVVPSWSRVCDLYWLSYWCDAEGTVGEIAATLAWVCGGVDAPVTGREEQPVTELVAWAEWEAANAQGNAAIPQQADVVCAELGVPYYPAQNVSKEWARKVWNALGWLRGPRLGAARAMPPMTLPTRNANGKLATAVELYDAAVASAPTLYRTTEQQIELRNKVEAVADLSHRLDRIITDTQHQVGVTV